MLIKKIRNKDCSPLLNTFILPVGCLCGYQIRIDLKLCPYENREKRSVSLIAIITIPQRCSQRRLFIHACESKYRLSTDNITSEGMRIANSCCKVAMAAPSDNNEVHETCIYFDNILSHEELLHHIVVHLNVVLQLFLLGSRLPTPQVTVFDEDGFLRIETRQ